MKLYSLIQLLMKRFSRSTIRGMEGCIITVCTSATAYLAISIRARESRIQHNLLESFAVFPLEISDE
jgi:hypothetical protein